MFTLVKNARIYAPKDLGVLDMLICNQKIVAMGQLDDVSVPELELIDLQGKITVPGFVDQHVHLIGGGGEAGVTSRTPEIQISTIVKYGVTSVLGLLGTDCDTRHSSTLYSKAVALTQEGISAWMLTGGYNLPSPTVGKSIRDDILYLDRCLGLKLAISDSRAPHVSYDEFIRLASDCRVAGMLSGKSGTMTIHLGDAPQGLELLFQSQKDSAIPKRLFIPTHLNRKDYLYDEAIAWGKFGGNIDITAGLTGSKTVTAIDALVRAREADINEELITVSTDAQGSLPIFDKNGNLEGITVAKQDGLLSALQAQIQQGYDISTALKPITQSVAKLLKLVNKGTICKGSDADFVVLSDDYQLEQTWAKGKCVYRDGQSLVHNMFE